MKGLESKMLGIILAIVIVGAIVLLAYYFILAGTNPFKDFLANSNPQSIIGQLGGGGQ